MQKNYPYLKDTPFLDEFFRLKISSLLAKITSLDWEENEIESIEGKIVSGSFNKDGNSALRRTGNLSIVAEANNLYNINSLLSINKKIDVQIGLKNFTNKYTDFPILWFPMGVFIIQTLNIQRSLSAYTINIQMQDKMCLLNGTCGGIIPASTVFDTMDTFDNNGHVVTTRPTVYQIIIELMNHFGQEPLHRIIVSDIETRVKQVMRWTSSAPLYMVQKQNQYQMTVNSKTYLNWINQGWVNVEGSPFEYGRDVGYIYTDFTYPGELICGAGDTITSVLDNIVSVLGNYEYFYDVYGNFIFQQIKNYLNNSYSKTIIEELKANNYTMPSENYLLDTLNGKSVYDFKDSELISSYSNSPNYNMIKNDFTVWGVRKGDNNFQVPVRYHLVIDKKPQIGNVYYAFKYLDPDDGLEKWHCPIKYSNKNKLPNKGTEGVFYYVEDTQQIYTWTMNSSSKKDYVKINATIERITTKDWRTQLYFQGVAAQPLGLESNPYYAELKNEWPKIYNIVPDELNSLGQYVNKSDFKPEYLQDVSQINYFLDFIDSDSNIKEFSVSNIGRRQQIINDNNVNCVFEPSIPDVVLIRQSGSNDQVDGVPSTETSILRQQCQDRNQSYYQVPDNIYDLLSGGGGFNSAYQAIRQLLHQYTSYNENISFTCIPLYFLQPKTRISITDEESGIYGDYMINTISFNIDNSNSMNVNATRALEKI